MAFLECPDCHEQINVGNAGVENLNKRHRNTASCKAKQVKSKQQRELNNSRSLLASFFRPKALYVPATVALPKLVYGDHIAGPQSYPGDVGFRGMSKEDDEGGAGSSHEPLCKKTSRVLENLRVRIEQLPEDVGLADVSHPLAQFCGNPAASIEVGEDAWEVWDGPLNTVLQREAAELHALVCLGDYGLPGLYRFLKSLVEQHGVGEGLIEGKVQRLITAMDEVAPVVEAREHSSDMQASKKAKAQGSSSLAPREVKLPVSTKVVPRTRCNGFQVPLSEGKSPHSSYPFALHDEINLPWNYTVTEGILVLHSQVCKVHVPKDSKQCQSCHNLERNDILAGIMRRIDEGVHPNARLAYHGFGGLKEIIRAKEAQRDLNRLQGFNIARKLTRKAATLDHHKELMMALGSGKVERVERVLHMGLKAGRGVVGLLKLYEEAVEGVYRPRTYSEKDALRGLLIWRMGGERVAQVAYRTLGLPSISTLRRHTLIAPLIASSGKPTVAEVSHNIGACFTPLEDGQPSTGIVHQVLMLDELKVEGRLRYDERTNFILGSCREHSTRGSLEYQSECEPQMLIEALKRGDMHVASEATVGALGLLCGNTRLYSARPILVSGSCKRESGFDHAKVIQTCLEATKKKTTYRVICIASDGESRRGEALVALTFSRPLSPTSPIYPILSTLHLMNLEVGDDDLTADKDYKHVIKRCRNLIIRPRGFKIHGIHITTTMLRAHLRADGINQSRIDTLLKPDDKQDVKLAYDVLQTIWSLTTPKPDADPGFAATRSALISLGRLFQHITTPYICVDMSLSEQLTHLSTAAHIVLAMAREDNAGSLLMPTQLYLDIIIMIKNAYFCVAKTKVDQPTGQFWIILLGTDRLEVLFGILRTMVGNDANLDVLQLVQRLTGTTEVSTILARYPEWDRSPRRLKLPPLSKDGFVVHPSVDHINPASWRGDVNVSKVNLQTCWDLGCQNLLAEIPRLHNILTRIPPLVAAGQKIDIFHPFGQDPATKESVGTEIDDTAEDFGVLTVDKGSILQPGPSPDFEDALNEDLDTTNLTELSSESRPKPYLELDGAKLYKSRYLNQIFREYKDPTPDSHDRLKRVASVPRYAIKQDNTPCEVINHASDVPHLTLDTPIITLLRCQEHIFVGIGEVNDIILETHRLEAIPIDKLMHPKATVSYQLLFIVPATIDDDPSHQYDWRWSLQRGPTLRIPGRLLEPINPVTNVTEPGKPFYLFESGSLMAIGHLLFKRLDANDGRLLPAVESNANYPYRNSANKDCFICEDPDKQLELIEARQCPKCSPAIELPQSGPKLLEHMAAHILFDPSCNASMQPCGMCLRTSPPCIFYLKKGRNANSPPQVNQETSNCLNYVHFLYVPATTSTLQSPCSNVPIPCPECIKTNKGAPAIWKYNLRSHLKEKHPYVQDEYNHLFKIERLEMDGLKAVWDERYKKRQAYKSKKVVRQLNVSNEHSTGQILRTEIREEDEGSTSGNNQGDTMPSGVDGDTTTADLGDVNDEIAGGDDEHSEVVDLYGRDVGESDWNSWGGHVEVPTGAEAGRSASEPGNEVTSMGNKANENDTSMDGNNRMMAPQGPVPDAYNENAVTPTRANEGGEGTSTVGPATSATAPRVPVADSYDENPFTITVANNSGGGARSQRVHKTRNLAALQDCTGCGIAVSEDEKQAKAEVIECKRPGCQTQWYHLRCVELDYHPRNWACDACKAQGSSRPLKKRRVAQ